MFGQNSWSNPFGNDNFLPFLKVQFFGLKMTVFYSKYRTTIFSDIISVKNSHKRKFDFWTKSMDKPFKKCPLLGPPFRTSIFWSKNDCFLSKILKNDLFWNNFCEKHR